MLTFPMLKKVKEKKKFKTSFTMMTKDDVAGTTKLKDILAILPDLGKDPDDFIKLIPENKIHNSVYLSVSHPLIGSGEEDKYLLEIRFEKDNPPDFLHFELLTGDKKYMTSVVTKYFKNGRIPSLKTWKNVTASFKREMYNADLIGAHRFSSNHRYRLQLDSKCGCFYCGKIFSPSEINEWIDDPAGTAVCPYCGVDAVIGESSGYPITLEFLAKMRRYWFF